MQFPSCSASRALPGKQGPEKKHDDNNKPCTKSFPPVCLSVCLSVSLSCQSLLRPLLPPRTSSDRTFSRAYLPFALQRRRCQLYITPFSSTCFPLPTLSLSAVILPLGRSFLHPSEGTLNTTPILDSQSPSCVSLPFVPLSSLLHPTLAPIDHSHVCPSGFIITYTRRIPVFGIHLPLVSRCIAKDHTDIIHDL